MGNVVEKHLFTERVDEARLEPGITNFTVLDIPVNDIDGNKGTLRSFSSGAKLILVVNVATKWAFAHKNYVEIVNVANEYGPYGLCVIAFPCN